MTFERRPYRLSHCRFDNIKPLYKYKNCLTETNRVVSVAWKYDEKTEILSYGATIYKKSNDNWIKKDHSQTAIERFTTCPLHFKVDLKKLITRTSIDWYIARVLVLKYGCYFKGVLEKGEILPYNTLNIEEGFIEKYDPVGFGFFFRENDEVEYEDESYCLSAFVGAIVGVSFGLTVHYISSIYFT